MQSDGTASVLDGGGAVLRGTVWVEVGSRDLRARHGRRRAVPSGPGGVLRSHALRVVAAGRWSPVAVVVEAGYLQKVARAPENVGGGRGDGI